MCLHFSGFVFKLCLICVFFRRSMKADLVHFTCSSLDIQFRFRTDQSDFVVIFFFCIFNLNNSSVLIRIENWPLRI